MTGTSEPKCTHCGKQLQRVDSSEATWYECAACGVQE